MLLNLITRHKFAPVNNGIPNNCSRCKKDIVCSMHDIENCNCYQVKLSADCHHYLKETEYNCLCNECLLELNQLVEKAGTAPQKPMEGLHYYVENGLLVFTEFNHIQRGYCCKSGCRHCAYGYKPG